MAQPPESVLNPNMFAGAFIAVIVAASAAWYFVSPAYPFETALKDRFADPSSVQIRNVVSDPGQPVKYCGEVNAKNLMGGYVGFQRFVAMTQGARFTVAIGPELAQFPSLWCG